MIRFRVNEEEARRLNDEVKKTGMSREQYLRLATLLKTPKAKPPADFAGVLRELTRIRLTLETLAWGETPRGIHYDEFRKHIATIEGLMTKLILEVTA